jgi:hypothetical protein
MSLAGRAETLHYQQKKEESHGMVLGEHCAFVPFLPDHCAIGQEWYFQEIFCGGVTWWAKTSYRQVNDAK